MCAVISTVNVIALVVIAVAIDPEEPGFALALPQKLSRQSGGSKGSYEWVSKYFVTEMVIGNMVFWLIGGKVLASSYIEDYVADSGVVPRYDKSWALMVVWVMIAVGRFGGLWDQIQLNKLGGAALNPIYFHLASWIGTGLLGGVIWCIWPKYNVCFWLAICLYGFGNGPCVGYCYDINNRLTVPSETGMSIVMFGLNFGASLVPYVSTVIWDNSSLSYYTLPLITCISMLLPLPLLYLTRVFNNTEKAAVGTTPHAAKDVA
jgi:fucose permease